MDTIHAVLRYTHIIGGFIGLVLFWIPIFSKKGGKAHRQMGKYWTWLAYVVLGSAFLGLCLYIPGIIAAKAQPNEYAFLLFLGYLSIVAYIAVIYGVAVLKSKADATQMNTPFWNGVVALSMLSSIFIIAFAFIFKPDTMPVLLALSPIGIMYGLQIRKYIQGKHGSPKAWLYEHLDSMLGAGIAFHTAFAVFGITRIFDIGLEGYVAVIPWILPAAIGIPAQYLWKRHYQKKFKEI